MMDITFIRGNVLQFSTSFFDASGGVVDPASALLTLRTAPLGADSDLEQISMSKIGDTWVAEWDTTSIAPGIVYWSVQATGPHAADDGSFDLSANWANEAVP